MMRIGSKLIEFELHVDEKLPAVLLGDQLRIKQILSNLLSNAFKYTERGSVSLEVAVESNPDTPESAVLVMTVKDTGVGMTDDQLAQLFEEYVRFHQACATCEGTGLGLAITKHLLQLMQGEIDVRSEPGKGTCVTVTLPQTRVDDAVIGEEAAANLRRSRGNDLSSRRRGSVRKAMPHGQVLIVDDMDSNLYVTSGLMKLYKLQIDTAESGLEAIDKVASKMKAGEKYDVVFMDHMMPEPDGIETTRRLREMGYGGAIVVLTANAVVGQSAFFKDSGFDDFISKPIDIRRLDLVLEKFVSSAGAIDPVLLESFLKDAEKTIAVLEGEFDLKSYTIAVHGIKGALWNIGEHEFSGIARQLEAVARSQNLTALPPQAAQFAKSLAVLRGEMQAQKEQFAAPVHGGGDPNILRESLIAAAQSCSEFNRKGALDILAELGGYSPEVSKALEQIKDLVLHSEFDAAEEKLREIFGGLK
jgi:CheY-like chemotaxis protein/anti-sigma regulatory factor (Ser/Thr protein kinase)